LSCRIAAEDSFFGARFSAAAARAALPSAAGVSKNEACFRLLLFHIFFIASRPHPPHL